MNLFPDLFAPSFYKRTDEHYGRPIGSGTRFKYIVGIWLYNTAKGRSRTRIHINALSEQHHCCQDFNMLVSAGKAVLSTTGSNPNHDLKFQTI